MSKVIDEEKLKAAKEKLACKIEPAKYADAGASSRDKVLLTQMTSAGG